MYYSVVTTLCLIRPTSTASHLPGYLDIYSAATWDGEVTRGGLILVGVIELLPRPVPIPNMPLYRGGARSAICQCYCDATLDVVRSRG